MSNVTGIILAAGQGSRMGTKKAKVLHCLAEKPMISHVIETAEKICDQIIVVYGFSGEEVKQFVEQNHPNSDLVYQEEQKGTAHAVVQAEKIIKNEKVLVLYGDVPVISSPTLSLLAAELETHDIALLSVIQPNPFGYGRVVRNFAGNPLFIREEKDADEEQKKIQEVNTGIMALKKQAISSLLPKIKNKNQQKEYYLPDVFELGIKKGYKTTTVLTQNRHEVEGVNTLLQLESIERDLQKSRVNQLASKGVQFKDISRVDIRGEVTIGKNTIVDVNVVFEGIVSIGEGCRIESNCVIKDSEIKKEAQIKTNTIIERSIIGEACEVGPFARIRQGTKLHKSSKVGNFVETKKVNIGKNTKINHLSYIGDADIGADTNIGAGTITCNYDGKKKNQTCIGENVFIGSGSQLVAPVTIEKNATIGAGSTIRNSVPENSLSLSEKKQKTIEDWKKKR